MMRGSGGHREDDGGRGGDVGDIEEMMGGTWRALQGCGVAVLSMGGSGGHRGG